MTESGEADVLVVGAGATGLTLAGLLRAMGVTVRIIDRQLDRVRESQALAVQPRTLEVLRGLGVTQTLVERGNEASQLRIHAGERIVPVRLFDVGLEDTAYPFLLFVSQAETEAVLNEHLAEHGVHVERGVELVAFEAGEEAVLCTLRGGDERTERLHARYLVGCDGAHSSVRHGAGIPFEGGAYPQTFVLGDLEGDGDLERDVGHAFLGVGGMLFFFPLARPATWRMLGIRPPGSEDDHERAEPALTDLQAIADAFTGGSLRLRDPVWLTYFRLHHRHAASYRAGRVFLAGDAAHVHSPAGAQGMNTGIQEAWNLGWKLALVAEGIADEAPGRLPSAKLRAGGGTPNGKPERASRGPGLGRDRGGLPQPPALRTNADDRSPRTARERPRLQPARDLRVRRARAVLLPELVPRLGAHGDAPGSCCRRR